MVGRALVTIYTCESHSRLDMLRHLLEIHGIARPVEAYQLTVPDQLEMVSCTACSPTKRFFGMPLDMLMLAVSQHRVLQHSDQLDAMCSGLMFECRLGDCRMSDVEPLIEHTAQHYLLLRTTSAVSPTEKDCR